jgi:hypothetical protein
MKKTGVDTPCVPQGGIRPGFYIIRTDAHVARSLQQDRISTQSLLLGSIFR